MKHNECGFDYYVTPSEFTGKESSRCPKCNISKGESTILFTLNKYSIKYEIQYKFEDCKYKNSLPFDFALFSEDELILLIE